MSNMTALDLIRKTFVKYTGCDPEVIVHEASLADLGVDSLTLAEMLFALEDQLGVIIVDTEVRSMTVAELIALIEPHLKANEPS